MIKGSNPNETERSCILTLGTIELSHWGAILPSVTRGLLCELRSEAAKACYTCCNVLLQRFGMEQSIAASTFCIMLRDFWRSALNAGWPSDFPQIAVLRRAEKQLQQSQSGIAKTDQDRPG